MRNRVNVWLVALAAAACGLAAGVWVAPRGGGEFSIPASVLPAIEAHAMATAAHDNFVIATGFVEDEAEGLFFLDFLTGDLKATVLNRRGAGFNAYYEHNIAEDFNVGAVADPKYLMVTGVARDLQVTGGSGALARSVVYIVEATTGQLVVYGIPYNRSRQSARKPQGGPFIKLASASLRTEFVRDQ